MPELAPLTAAEATEQLFAQADAVGSDVDKAALTAVHDIVRAVTGTTDEAPASLLDAAAEFASRAPSEAVESLPPRTRVAMRLLRAGAQHAAWAVATDNATGFVARSLGASTSSGADRTDWPLPLLTAVEPPRVFADLPGFRDPRYAVADELYEIGAALKLRCHVDEVADGRNPVLSGWAALDVLTTEPDEAVAIVAVQEGREVRWPGARLRRADLVGGNRDTIRRRAWAGWTVECRPAELGDGKGRWALSVEVTHRGLTRRARIGKSVGELAAAAVGRQLSDKPVTRLHAGSGGWAIGTG
ncbi:MAG: hypothetical protein ACTHK4_12365 [Mycobacteriales bacterium]